MFIYNEKKKEESLVILDYVILKLSEEVRPYMPSDDLSTIPETDINFIVNNVNKAIYKGVSMHTPGLFEDYSTILNGYLAAMGRTYKVALLNARGTDVPEDHIAIPRHGLVLGITFDPKVETSGPDVECGELINNMLAYKILRELLTDCRDGVSPVLTKAQDLEIWNLEANYRVANRDEMGELIKMVADEGGLRTTTEIKLAELVKPYEL